MNAMNGEVEAEERADLRVRRTRKLLWEALLAEMAARPFEQITVNDICARAMVHRTTFYKRYEDKYVLLEWGMRRMMRDALSVEGPHQPVSAYSFDQPPPYFVQLFEHAARHADFYRAMLGAQGVGRFQRMLLAAIVEVATAQAAPLLGDEPDGQAAALAVNMHAQFVAGGALSLLSWWLEHGMELTPRQMAGYIVAPYGPPTRDGQGEKAQEGPREHRDWRLRHGD